MLATRSAEPTGHIADTVNACLQAFQETLSKAVQTSDLERSDSCLPKFENQLARFRLWSGNIGAHRYGRSSLEYRLRDASHLRSQVIKLLGGLQESLSEGIVF